MAENFIIGIDIGTQGTKAVLMSESGTCASRAFVPSRLIQPSPGVVEEDPDEQLNSVITAIKNCLCEGKIKASSVAGIAISGQMAGIIGIGMGGLHVTHYDSWLDTRCSPFIEEMSEKAGERILKGSGHTPSFNHGPKILWWKSERPLIYNKILSFVQPASYAAMRLCGLSEKEAFIDNTYTHFSGFYNNEKNGWDEELCRMFGIDVNKMPAVVPPSSIIGRLTRTAAGNTGLTEGMPVAAGCGDTAASFLSAGAVGEGICVDVAGTASVFAATTSSFRADKLNMILGCGRSVTEGLWHPYAYINGGGMNLEWFRKNIIGTSACQDQTSLQSLNESAGKIKPSPDDPFFIPHMGGRVCPPAPALRGAWVNMSWSADSSMLYRSILESIAFEYAIFKDALEQLYKDHSIREMRITGGGEKSDLWNQMKADILGIKIARIEHNEGAPLGSAIIAGHAAGLLKSIPETVNNWINIKKEYTPDPELHNFYSERFSRYKSFLKKLL